MKKCVSLAVVLLGAESASIKHDDHSVHAIRKTVSPVHAAAAIVPKSLAAASAHHKVDGKSKIVPPLVDVTSDKKFFGPPFPADYPDDISPPVKRKLFKTNSVYPKIQEEGFFDKDFVKDENSDGGKWKAQSDYDFARTKIANQKRQAENAAKRAANEGKDVDEAAKKFADASHVEEAASAEEKKANDVVDAAKKKVDERAKEIADKRAAEAAAKEKEAQKTQEEREKELEERMKQAEDALAAEKESYQNCLKQLREAKAKVENLEKKQAEMKKEGWNTTKMIVAETEDLEAEKKAVEEAKAKTAKAEAEHQATLEKLEKAHIEAEAAKHELERQKAQNARATAAMQKEDQELHDAEQELANSKSNLRHIRGVDALPVGDRSADCDGPHPSPDCPTAPPKGSAMALGKSALLAALLATVVLF